MNNFLRHIKDLADAVASVKGEFSLFAAYQRKDALLENWDIVVSAPWLDSFGQDTIKATRSFIKEAYIHLSEKDIQEIGAIYVLSIDKPFVQEMLSRCSEEDRFPVVENNVEYGGMEMSRAYIFVAKKHISVPRENVSYSQSPTFIKTA